MVFGFVIMDSDENWHDIHKGVRLEDWDATKVFSVDKIDVWTADERFYVEIKPPVEAKVENLLVPNLQEAKVLIFCPYLKAAINLKKPEFAFSMGFSNAWFTSLPVLRMLDIRNFRLRGEQVDELHALADNMPHLLSINYTSEDDSAATVSMRNYLTRTKFDANDYQALREIYSVDTTDRERKELDLGVAFRDRESLLSLLLRAQTLNESLRDVSELTIEVFGWGCYLTLNAVLDSSWASTLRKIKFWGSLDGYANESIVSHLKHFISQPTKIKFFNISWWLHDTLYVDCDCFSFLIDTLLIRRMSVETYFDKAGYGTGFESIASRRRLQNGVALFPDAFYSRY